MANFMYIEFAKAFGILERKLSMKVYVCVDYMVIYFKSMQELLRDVQRIDSLDGRKVQDIGTIHYKQARIKSLNPCIILQAIDKFYHAHKRWKNNGDSWQLSRGTRNTWTANFTGSPSDNNQSTTESVKVIY
jgi:hypothetical protein